MSRVPFSLQMSVNNRGLRLDYAMCDITSQTKKAYRILMSPETAWNRRTRPESWDLLPGLYVQ
jgi:hypothetical protein